MVRKNICINDSTEQLLLMFQQNNSINGSTEQLY
jgi:hypothetical protein